MQPNENVVDKARVFVVHGRNEELRKSMFEFLRSIGLKPIEWSQAIQMTGETAPFIGDILDAAFQQAQAVVVLLNGDDEARLRPEYYSQNMPDYEKNLTPQARPNVLFEAGLALGRFPKRTIIVEVGDLRPFSDIAGRHTIRLNNSTKSRQDLAQRLSGARCEVDLSGTDWHQIGDFELPIFNFKNDIEDDQEPNKLSLQPKTIAKEHTSFRPGQVEILKYLSKYYIGNEEEIRDTLNIHGGVFVFDILIEELIKLDYVEISRYKKENSENDEEETFYYITKSGTKHLMDIGEI